ncbi:MAG TPA: hypothetical protein VMT94_05130 [Burkholderiales bacterium]|nr:hypothetical protein [Burkholderiales bacterium]
MMRLPRPVAGWIAASALMLSCSANALDVDLGTLTGTSFAQAYAYPSGSVIDDNFYFDLPVASAFNAVASQISIPGFFGISGFSFTLQEPDSTVVDFTPDLTDSVIQSGLQPLLAGDNYTAKITGVVNGSYGGSYSILMAAVDLNAFPVPEPAAWSTLLAGIMIGAVAMFGRRFTAGRRFPFRVAAN